MAYPYQISAADNLPNPTAGRVIHRSATVLYKHLHTTTATDHLSMHKSSDAGVTWAEQNSAGRPNTSTTAVPLAVGYADDGTRIWMKFIDSGGNSALKAFNTTTDLWESTITGGPLAAGAGSGGAINANAQYGLALPNGDNLVVYSVSGAGTICELWAKVYSGGSWGSAFRVLVQNFNEAGFSVPYNLLGVSLDSANRSHVWAWTPNGLAYVRINADYSLSNYFRLGMDAIDGELFGSRYGVFGEPRVVTMGGVEFAALPHNYQTVVDGKTFHRPGVLFVPCAGTNATPRIDQLGEFANNINFGSIGLSWLSSCIASDSTTGIVWLVWVDDQSTAFDYQSVIKATAMKGFDWTTPQTIFTPPLDSPIESMEVTVESGVLRAVIESSTAGTYLTPYYYQSSITASPTACSGGSGNINAAR